MLLNIKERYIALSLLPQNESFLTLKAIKTAKEILAVTEEEIKEFEIKLTKIEDKEQLTWNAKGNEEKEFEVSEQVQGLIKAKLKELDSEKKLADEHISLYEKFNA